MTYVRLLRNACFGGTLATSLLASTFARAAEPGGAAEPDSVIESGSVVDALPAPPVGHPAMQELSLTPIAPRLMLRPPVLMDLNAELAAIDAQIDALSAERAEYSIGGPIGLMAGGGGVILASLYVLLFNAMNASTCSDDPQYGEERCWDNDKVGTIGLVGVVAGGGMLLGGGLWLGERTGPRRELGEQIKALKRKRKNLLLTPPPVRDELGALSPGYVHQGVVGARGYHGLKLTLEL